MIIAFVLGILAFKLFLIVGAYVAIFAFIDRFG